MCPMVNNVGVGLSPAIHIHRTNPPGYKNSTSANVYNRAQLDSIGIRGVMGTKENKIRSRLVRVRRRGQPPWWIPLCLN